MMLRSAATVASLARPLSRRPLTGPSRPLFQTPTCLPRRCKATTTVGSPPTTHAIPTGAAGSASASAGEAQASLRPVAYWLFGTGALVGGMVAVGGLTRLTRSGLSMTDWKIQGSLPPITLEDWQAEFERYKSFPEFQQRRSMTLDEFKSIFWWEYGHRMMGRVVGLAYGVPLAYFALRGRIPKHLYSRMAVLFGLGGAQGLIGWWMVKSGLEMDPKQRQEIRVSPYRLTTHLSMAFTTCGLLVWTALDVLNPKDQLVRIASTMSSSALAQAKRVRSLGLLTGGLLGVTIVSGAFVAGIDAGFAYNTFPKMGDNWIPPMEELYDPALGIRNFFENTATVQLDHRLLAASTLTGVVGMYGLARRGALWAALPAQTRNALNATLAMTGAQVTLGISTLLLYVPIPLAVAHQVGALALLSCVSWSLHTLRFVRPSVLAQLVKNAPKL